MRFLIYVGVTLGAGAERYGRGKLSPCPQPVPGRSNVQSKGLLLTSEPAPWGPRTQGSACVDSPAFRQQLGGGSPVYFDICLLSSSSLLTVCWYTGDFRSRLPLLPPFFFFFKCKTTLSIIQFGALHLSLDTDLQAVGTELAHQLPRLSPSPWQVTYLYFVFLHSQRTLSRTLSRTNPWVLSFLGSSLPEKSFMLSCSWRQPG